MYIIGTSGHIDHGKTSVIAALTGTDCDRLPEEKERKMTIDLGFASINHPKIGTVSIIDVPGHERFIRNMVAGAWGIDIALLIVAVDDGWMPQTEDHFRVLQILGIKKIIPVMNKIDIADKEMIEFVEEEIKEKLNDSIYENSPIVKISAKKSIGIDELKKTIFAELKSLPKIKDYQKPYLFIDRVFASKGYGTIVTGTLKNGQLKTDEGVTLLPQKKEVRIKKIESHNSELAEGTPSARTALNLSSINKEDLKRGDILCKENFFTESKEIIVGIELLNSKKNLKNNQEIEVLIGTTVKKAKFILLNQDESTKKIFARLNFLENWFFYPGQLFIITNPGGYRIIGGGTVINTSFDKSQKKFLKEKISELKNLSTESIINFIIEINHFIDEEKLLASLIFNRITLDKNLKKLEENKKIVRIKNWSIDLIYFNQIKIDALEIVKNNIGLNLQEISHLLKCNREISNEILENLSKEFPLIEKNGQFFYGETITEENLPAKKQQILKNILNQSDSGIELTKEKNENLKQEIKDLLKLNFLVSLDGNIIYHQKIYTQLKEKILQLFESNEKITVPQAKDAVNLSRKYIIPLLNRIESDGEIKRLGDFRIKTS